MTNTQFDIIRYVFVVLAIVCTTSNHNAATLNYYHSLL